LCHCAQPNRNGSRSVLVLALKITAEKMRAYLGSSRRESEIDRVRLELARGIQFGQLRVAVLPYQQHRTFRRKSLMANIGRHRANVSWLHHCARAWESAISVCDRPDQNARLSTVRCSSGSAATAATGGSADGGVVAAAGAAVAAAGYRLAAHDTLPSTNTEALALARRGETGPRWVTARQQTEGRGRRGSEWISTPGNLYATLLLCDPAAPENAPELSFVAALAVHDAIADRAAPLREKLALKWPNDILCGDAKLTGILIEGESIEGRLVVVVGIGVNCRHHPPPANHPTTDLAAPGADVSAEGLFTALSGMMLRRLVQWHPGGGLDLIFFFNY